MVIAISFNVTGPWSCYPYPVGHGIGGNTATGMVQAKQYIRANFLSTLFVSRHKYATYFVIQWRLSINRGFFTGAAVDPFNDHLAHGGFVTQPNRRSEY